MLFENLMIDRILDLAQFDRDTGEAEFILPEVQDFSISVTTNEDEITDATGSPIAVLESAKQAELSGNAAFINVALMAAQSGADLDKGAISNMPIMEQRTVSSEGTITLAHTPVGTAGSEIGYIYIRNNDGTKGETLEQGTDAAQATQSAKAKFSVSGGVVTFPAAPASGETGTDYTGKIVYIPYEYASTSGLHFKSLDDEFTTSSMIKARLLVRDVCNDKHVTVVTIVSENAKLTSAFDLTLARSEQHPFTYRVMPSYCGSSGAKALFELFEMDTEEWGAVDTAEKATTRS